MVSCNILCLPDEAKVRQDFLFSLLAVIMNYNLTSRVNI